MPRIRKVHYKVRYAYNGQKPNFMGFPITNRMPQYDYLPDDSYTHEPVESEPKKKVVKHNYMERYLTWEGLNLSPLDYYLQHTIIWWPINNTV